MASPSINTRADLDSIAGTPEYAAFIGLLKGSMTQRRDTAVYPADYNQPGYTGAVIAPVWSDVEDLSTITRFGFTKAEILAL